MPRFVGPAGCINVTQRFSSRLPEAVTVTALGFMLPCTGQGRQCYPHVAWFTPHKGVSPRPQQSSLRIPAGIRGSLEHIHHNIHEASFHAFRITNLLTLRNGPAVTAGEGSGTHKHPWSASPQWVRFQWPPTILCPGLRPRRDASVRD